MGYSRATRTGPTKAGRVARFGCRGALVMKHIEQSIAKQHPQPVLSLGPEEESIRVTKGQLAMSNPSDGKKSWLGIRQMRPPRSAQEVLQQGWDGCHHLINVWWRYQYAV